MSIEKQVLLFTGQKKAAKKKIKVIKKEGQKRNKWNNKHLFECN